MYEMDPRPNTDSYYQNNSLEPSNNNRNHSGKKGPTWGKIIALMLIFSLLSGGIGGAVGMMVGRSSAPVEAENISSTAETTQRPESIPADTETSSLSQITAESSSSYPVMSYEEIYAAANPACVAISVSGTQTNMFGQKSEFASAGSGFIISEDGYIVTNHHVISGSESISVVLSDGTTYDAQLIASDSDIDIALLKINASGLSFLTFGDSDQLAVGQNVVAIGNPLGELANTMTTGIISALDRNINIDGITMNLLQTSTAVSPGNSGCPLIDMTGHVIGVINSKSGGTSVEGIGFAISANKALSAINDLMEYGYVRGKAALGISVNIKYTSAYASYYNLPEGALVQSVASGYCSDKAGIVAGDVIVGIDDTVVGSYQDLESALKSYKAGDTVTVKVNRAGQELTMTVTLDEKTPELTQESITVESSEPENNQDQSPENNQDLPSQGNLPQIPDQEEETPSSNSESDLFSEFFPWFQD